MFLWSYTYVAMYAVVYLHTSDLKHMYCLCVEKEKYIGPKNIFFNPNDIDLFIKATISNHVCTWRHSQQIEVWIAPGCISALITVVIDNEPV
jgi:hypothetical protein